MAKRPTRSSSATVAIRAQTFAQMIAQGSTRRDCLRYATETWGVSERTVDSYMAAARDLIKADWSNVAREQMAAEILSRYATLEQKARETDQLHVALGAIHGAARLAKLIS